jgi:hypothetical protein
VELSIVRLPGVAWVHLSGELDLLSRGEFQRELQAIPPAEERPEAIATLAGETIFGLGSADGSEVGGRGPVAAA